LYTQQTYVVLGLGLGLVGLGLGLRLGLWQICYITAECTRLVDPIYTFIHHK